MIREKLTKLIELITDDTLNHTGEYLLSHRKSVEDGAIILAAHIDKQNDLFILDVNHECVRVYLNISDITSIDRHGLGCLEIKFNDPDAIIADRAGNLLHHVSGVSSFLVYRFELQRVIKHFDL